MGVEQDRQHRRFAGLDGVNRHRTGIGDLGQEGTADDGRVGRDRYLPHPFEEFQVCLIEAVAGVKYDFLRQLRRTGFLVEHEVFIEQQVDFFVIRGNGPQGIEGVVGRAVQTEDGNGVDGLGQYLVGAAGGDDDLGSFFDQGMGLGDEVGKVDDFDVDDEVVLF